jgi:hypothetical protein
MCSGVVAQTGDAGIEIMLELQTLALVREFERCEVHSPSGVENEAVMDGGVAQAILCNAGRM